jgi:hypothetical protein
MKDTLGLLPYGLTLDSNLDETPWGVTYLHEHMRIKR